MGKLDNLNIYQKSLNLVKEIYTLIKNNQNLSKDFSLCDQIKRASVSVPTNISEGYYRTSKQSKNYLHIASGSANEVITLLKIIDLVYLIDANKLQGDFNYLTKQIMSFCESF